MHVVSIRADLNLGFYSKAPSLTPHALLHLFIFTAQGWQTMPARGMTMQVPTEGLVPTEFLAPGPDTVCMASALVFGVSPARR